MGTVSIARHSSVLLLFAALVSGKGGGNETYCDKQDVAVCYWGFADRFGKIPLLGRKDNKTSYLTNLCLSESSKFPEYNFCKQHRYAVAQLRECIDLNVMRTCSVSLDIKSGTLEDQVPEQNRGAQNLKGCVEAAVKTCGVKKHHAAISHLLKIVDAIVELSWLPLMQNAAYPTKSATAAIAACLLGLAVRSYV
ncbi:uncharacterized protein LOC142761666 isoform X2 [Rhipicephalus microplus]|uniref:uncharacterized protein LOC142761666 isoform X2 n=1 Tax=Rhipicephalus microplus TaxID=6941 RepID=UPI003F6C8978